MSDAWNPGQYGKFADERSRPFYDLAALVEGPVGRAIDLGCGPGSLTAELPELVGAQEVLGLDNSPAMLAAAEPHRRPGVAFAAGDLATWRDPGAWDLVFSNAALQWTGDHAAVLRRWQDSLRPGGQLAVQMPKNSGHPAARMAAELAHEEPYRSACGGQPPPDTVAANVLEPADYALLLHQLGFAEQRVRLEVYLHRLESTAAVVEWLKGTSLTRFAKLMPAEIFALYLDELRSRLVQELGDLQPYPFTFQRMLLWAR